MLGVMIVDDETIVRCGVRAMLDWEKLGLTVVAEAVNGREALAFYRQYHPAIVITDVKMPLMDGIELIQAIRAESEDTKIVILSCYQDFNYAREAMRSGACEYLIKSDIMPADLEKLLVKLKDTIRIKRARQDENAAKPLHPRVLFKEKFFADLVLGILPPKEQFQEDLRQLGIDYLASGLVLFNIWICYFDKLTAGLSEKGKNELHHGVAQLIRETLETDARLHGEIFPGVSGEINVVLKVQSLDEVKSDAETIGEAAEMMIRRVQTEFGYSISIGVSEIFDHLADFKQACNQAQKACKFRMFFGCGRIIHYREILTSGGPVKNVMVNIKELQDDVYFLKRERVGTILRDLFAMLRDARDDESVHLISLELVLTLNNLYAEITRDNADILRKKKEYYDQIKLLETVTDILTWFETTFNQLMDKMQAVYHNDRNMIAKALNYINAHYQQDLSLRVVSEHIHLSKNYFANLFKQETGESFVEYLTKLRIEKAKSLLESSNLKTYDIGNVVGIGDAHYFSKVFKKITGLTPTEYKESFRK